MDNLDFTNIQNITFLGPNGSYTDMACDYFMNKYEINAYPIAQKTIHQVFEFLDDNEDSLAVLPVENSVEGATVETLDNLVSCKNPNVRILSEVTMPVELCLLARTTEIYSITGGLIAPVPTQAKCQKFILNDLPIRIELLDASTTEEAAKSLRNYNLTYASVGTKKTADIFSLNVLKENIGDNKTEYTRFALIGDIESEYTKGMYSSMAFSTENKPGALLDSLQVFRNNKINLTYIASRPSKTKAGEYVFYVTIDGLSGKMQILKAVEELRPKTSFLRFLGSYERFKSACQ